MPEDGAADEKGVAQNECSEGSLAFVRGIDTFPFLHAIPEFRDHLLKSAVAGFRGFAPERVLEGLNQHLEAAETVIDAGAGRFIHGARAFRMDAKGAEFLLEEIPVGHRETPKPVFDVEKLRHVLAKWSHFLNDFTPEHHEARFPDDIGMQLVRGPPLEEVGASMEPRCNVFPPVASKLLIEVDRRHFVLVMVLMVYGDKSHMGVLREDIECTSQIRVVPRIILEEVLDKRCVTRVRKTCIPIPPNAETLRTSNEAEPLVAYIWADDPRDITLRRIIVNEAFPLGFGLVHDALEGFPEVPGVRFVRWDKNGDNRGVHDRRTLYFLRYAH